MHIIISPSFDIVCVCVCVCVCVQVPLGGDAHSWVLTSEGTTVHNAEAITRLKEKANEGDVVVRHPLDTTTHPQHAYMYMYKNYT